VTDLQVLTQEIRSLCAEMVGELRIISEGINPLTRSGMRSLCLELESELRNLCRLCDRLP
jgi:hypothetical protein